MTIQEVAASFTAAAPSFEAMARTVIRHQMRRNAVYRRYVEAVGSPSDHVVYLPVEAFKLAPVTTFPPEEAEAVFESSGTGRGEVSRHYVRDPEIYRRAIASHFSTVFGRGPFTMAAHLPEYAGRGSRSSLLFMVEHLLERFGDGAGGFFLDDYSLLERALAHAAREKTPFLLFGAAFGLLDLVEAQQWHLPAGALVIETGGMKTHRREIGRAALHRRLADGFSLERERIRSEYGMCELLSQCYTHGGEVFYPPSWMRFEVVDPGDASKVLPEGEPGALAVLDVANMHSASALLTEDRAVRRGEGFEVVGRLSGAELRGCNFLLESEQRP